MALKPIPGAPLGAPIPDFPTAEPAPLAVPALQAARPPVAAVPSSAAPPQARRSAPIEIRGSGDLTLAFRVVPEVPAINRASMTISITGEPRPDHSPRPMPLLDLAIDEAKAFLLALRDGHSPIAIADSRTAFQLEFAIAEGGAVFTVSKPGDERAAQRFNPGPISEVKTMAAHLLAALGP